MGHERVGALPHTRPWIRVVGQLAAAAGADADVADLAASTLENVRSRFRNIHHDAGVRSAFQFLLSLAISGSAQAGHQLSGPLNIDLASNPSPLKLASQLAERIDSSRESAEYADIARRAGVDVIVLWTNQQKLQPDFTGESSKALEIWRKAGTGAGFCEVARFFFAKFTERYLNYFLDRESSAIAANIADRDRLASSVRDHVDEVSRHAFETAKITQSFAAGWFNRHARSGMPSGDEIEGFLGIAFGKIREELLRESLCR